MRPSVLMFGDTDAVLLEALSASASRYQAWEDEVEEALAGDPGLHLVVLELGCGKRVPCVRQETESVVRDALAKGARATLIRINPQVEEQADDGVPAMVATPLAAGPHLIEIHDKALCALRRIDSILTAVGREPHVEEPPTHVEEPPTHAHTRA